MAFSFWIQLPRITVLGERQSVLPGVFESCPNKNSRVGKRVVNLHASMMVTTTDFRHETRRFELDAAYLKCLGSLSIVSLPKLETSGYKYAILGDNCFIWLPTDPIFNDMEHFLMHGRKISNGFFVLNPAFPSRKALQRYKASRRDKERSGIRVVTGGSNGEPSTAAGGATSSTTRRRVFTASTCSTASRSSSSASGGSGGGDDPHRPRALGWTDETPDRMTPDHTEEDDDEVSSDPMVNRDRHRFAVLLHRRERASKERRDQRAKFEAKIRRLRLATPLFFEDCSDSCNALRLMLLRRLACSAIARRRKWLGRRTSRRLQHIGGMKRLSAGRH